jgi:small subunit ribosomal protein S20
MAKTRSAAKHARQTVRRRAHNRSVKSSIHNLEKKYLALIEAGKKDEAMAMLGRVFSEYDKAAKTKVVHRNTADRKKSRLSVKLAVKAA